MTTTARGARYAAFAALAILVNVLVFRFHSGLLGAAGRQDMVRAGLFFDCVITVPLCYWLLLVRPGLRGRMSLVLIAAVSILRGVYLLPSRASMIIGIAVEVHWPSSWRRASSASKTAAIENTRADPARGDRRLPLRFRALEAAGLPKAHGPSRSTKRAEPHFVLDARPVDSRRSGGDALFLSVKLAWTLTALSAYSAIWMVAVARSFTALPLLVDAQGIALRRGMMASLYVPRDVIQSVSRTQEPTTLTLALPCLPIPPCGSPSIDPSRFNSRWVSLVRFTVRRSRQMTPPDSLAPFDFHFPKRSEVSDDMITRLGIIEASHHSCRDPIALFQSQSVLR